MYYDAAGNKLKKEVNETGQPLKTTLYLFGTYENDVLQFLPMEEGRIRPLRDANNNITSFTYDYFIKDHLGNVRMVLTEEQKTDAYPAATMETATISSESTYYGNLTNTQWAKPSWFSDPVYPTNAQVARVKNAAGSQKVGPAILLKVMAGDSYNIRVASGWSSGSTPTNSPTEVINDLVLALSSGLASASGGKAIQVQLQDPSSGLSTGVSNFLNTQSNSGAPKAYINWILFDEQFKYYSGGFEQVGASGATTIHLKNGLAVGKNGYLYVYTSNEATNIDVFFDNLQVTHVRGPIVEETHYYPFGLVMSGISSKAMAFGSPNNKYKFNNGNELQSQEFSDGSGLEMYDAVNRMYDPQLGRFGQIDPLAKATCEESPYSFAHNNPILFNDPLGLKATSDSTRAPDGEMVADKGSMTPVVVTTLPKGFWSKQRLYLDIMDGLKRRGATIDDIPQENLREMMYRYDDINKFRERVNDMTHASDGYVWGTFLAPFAAMFVAEVGAPLLYQGGRWLIRVGKEYIPWEKITELYNESGRFANYWVNERRKELLMAIAGTLYKNDPQKWSELMKKSEDVKNMGPGTQKALKEIIDQIQKYVEKHHK